MKRFLLVFLILCCSFSCASASVDLSNMSFEDLLSLRQQVNMALWACDEWQSVEVPNGVYQIGKDIPAGKWTISAADGVRTELVWTDVLNESGTGLSYDGDISVYEPLYSPTSRYYDYGDSTSVTWNLSDGQYLIVESGIAVFTPSTGVPDLGFK